jgi:hypothetical protein
MNWQQLILLAVVLAVAVVFVWRSSGAKKSDGGCDCCDCSHDHQGAHGSSPVKK